MRDASFHIYTATQPADACAAAIESVNQLHETIGTTAAICLAVLLFVLVFRNRR